MKKIAILLVLAVAGYFAYQQWQGSKNPPLDALYELPYIVVYGTRQCGWTQRCLKELKQDGIDVIFENIDKPEVKEEIYPRLDAAGFSRYHFSIPVVDVNGHIVIGYQREKILAFYEAYGENDE